MTKEPKYDGSIEGLVAWDAEVNSMAVAALYAADLRGDRDLSNSSLTQRFFNAFCEKLEEITENEELRLRVLRVFETIVEARETKQSVVMLSALQEMGEIVGVQLVPDN